MRKNKYSKGTPSLQSRLITIVKKAQPVQEVFDDDKKIDSYDCDCRDVRGGCCTGGRSIDWDEGP